MLTSKDLRSHIDDLIVSTLAENHRVKLRFIGRRQGPGF